MTTTEIITHIVTLLGGGVLSFFFLPKKEKKDFDTKLRDELWDRIKNLEGRLDAMNQMLLATVQENAVLKLENLKLKEAAPGS